MIDGIAQVTVHVEPVVRDSRAVLVVKIHPIMDCELVCEIGLQNAMTSSEERTSAEAEGYRIHQ